jgi:hypothetical protein
MVVQEYIIRIWLMGLGYQMTLPGNCFGARAKIINNNK